MSTYCDLCAYVVNTNTDFIAMDQQYLQADNFQELYNLASQIIYL